MKPHTIKISRNQRKKFEIVKKYHGVHKSLADLRLNKSTILFAPNGAGKTTLFNVVTKDRKIFTPKDPIRYALKETRIYEEENENFFSPFHTFDIPSVNLNKKAKDIWNTYNEIKAEKYVMEREVDNSDLFKWMYKSNLKLIPLRDSFEYTGNTSNMTEAFEAIRNMEDVDSLKQRSLGNVNLGISPKFYEKIYKREIKYIKEITETEFQKYINSLISNHYESIASTKKGNQDKKTFEMTFMSLIFQDFDYVFNNRIINGLVNHITSGKELNKGIYLKFLTTTYNSHIDARDAVIFKIASLNKTIKRKFEIIKFNNDRVIKKTERILKNRFGIETKINPQKLHNKNLSFGQNRILSIIFISNMFLETNSNIMIMDDPSKGLSENHKFLLAEFLRDISKIKKTWIYTHDISFLKQLKGMDKRDQIFDVDTLFVAPQGTRIIERVTMYAPFLFNFSPDRINEIWEILKKKQNINPVILSLMPAMYRSQIEFADVFVSSKENKKWIKDTSDLLHNRKKILESASELGSVIKERGSIFEIIGTPFDDVIKSVNDMASLNAGLFGIFDPNFESYYLVQHFKKMAIIILYRGLIRETPRFLPMAAFDISPDDSDRSILKKIKKTDFNTWKKISELRGRNSNKINNLIHYSGFTGDLIHDYHEAIFHDILVQIVDIRNDLMGKRFNFKAK